MAIKFRTDSPLNPYPPCLFCSRSGPDTPAATAPWAWMWVTADFTSLQQESPNTKSYF
jgi:hypothetical protein